MVGLLQLHDDQHTQKNHTPTDCHSISELFLLATPHIETIQIDSFQNDDPIEFSVQAHTHTLYPH